MQKLNWREILPMATAVVCAVAGVVELAVHDDPQGAGLMFAITGVMAVYAAVIRRRRSLESDK